MKDKLRHILLERRGGATSLKVTDLLLKFPLNINEIARMISMDYNTVRYHVELLCEHDILKRDNSNYGCVYQVTSDLLDNIESYESTRRILYEKLKLQDDI